MSKTNNNDFKVSFGRVKSIDVSNVVYKREVKENPYIRSKTYLKRKGVSTKGMTNSEAY